MSVPSAAPPPASPAASPADPRITPANGRVAHLSLRGRVPALRFVAGEPARIARPLADLLDAPGGRRQRQVLRGERVLVLEREAGFAFVQSSRNGYCGYVPESALGKDTPATHWVRAPATHLYPEPDIKAPEIGSVSIGARLAVTGAAGQFLATDAGEYVPQVHLQPVGTWAPDPVEVALGLLGTPYLWGGNSRAGLDCSGLVETALAACGRACPGDSDLQEKALGTRLPDGTSPARGDLVFWRGHVAMATGDGRIVHATAHAMAVILEDFGQAVARIDASGGGMPTSLRRP
ncbi:MAG: NlpC/P60 family protein [Pseudomonadota bacterium]